MVKELTAQIKDFEGNREERMKKLKKEIEAANKEVKAKEKEMAELAKTETKAQVVLDDLAKELEARGDDYEGGDYGFAGADGVGDRGEGRRRAVEARRV